MASIPRSRSSPSRSVHGVPSRPVGRLRPLSPVPTSRGPVAGDNHLDELELVRCEHDRHGGARRRPVRPVRREQGAVDAPVEGALRRGHHVRALHRLRRLRHRLPARRHRLRARAGRLQALPPRGGAGSRQLHPRREGLHVLHPGLPALPRLGAAGRRAPLRRVRQSPTSRRASTRTSCSPGPATTWSTRWARTAGSCPPC